MMEIQRYDDKLAVELAPGVYHLGVQDEENSWANIPYMVVDGGEAVVIDPGSARPEFFEVVLTKIRSVIDPRAVRYMVVQHQDPDVAAALPLLGPHVSPGCEILAPLESRLLVEHYAAQHPIRTVDDDDTVTFGDGRTLLFAMTPYCHFIGSMVTYDVQSKSLFSSDAFGGFGDDNALFAQPEYAQQMSVFLGEYLGSKRALEYALKRLLQVAEAHGVARICPQHGCVIPGDQVAAYIEAGFGLVVGQQVDDLAAKHGIELVAGD